MVVTHTTIRHTFSDALLPQEGWHMSLLRSEIRNANVFFGAYAKHSALIVGLVLHFVAEGALCRFKMLPEGRRRILQFLFPGDGFGFENGKRRDDTVTALTEAKVISLGKDTLLEVAKSDVCLSNLLFTAAARAAAVATEQSNALRGRKVTEQLALFLLEMDSRLSKGGEIYLPMHRQHIADYFGLSMETVSRTFSAFHKARIIDFLDNPKVQRRVVIRDKRRLERFASDAADFGWGKS
jgi:CRP/FNR family transcriptional regulator